jgi:hypothetical protein
LGMDYARNVGIEVQEHITDGYIRNMLEYQEANKGAMVVDYDIRRVGRRVGVASHNRPKLCISIPIETVGECKRCSVEARLGDGLCKRCWDRKIGKNKYLRA